MKPLAAEKVRVQINGESREIEPSTSVAQMLDHLRIRREACAVELNREVLDRSLFESTLLSAGDVLEIVHFVGGGALGS